MRFLLWGRLHFVLRWQQFIAKIVSITNHNLRRLSSAFFAFVRLVLPYNHTNVVDIWSHGIVFEWQNVCLFFWVLIFVFPLEREICLQHGIDFNRNAYTVGIHVLTTIYGLIFGAFHFFHYYDDTIIHLWVLILVSFHVLLVK